MRRLLVFLLLIGFTSVDQAIVNAQRTGAEEQPPKTKVERLRDEAQRVYVGRSVRVHLMDGTTATGRLLGGDESGLTIQPSPSDEPTLIRYELVESIAVGMRRWQKIAIGVGAVGAIALVAAAR